MGLVGAVSLRLHKSLRLDDHYEGIVSYKDMMLGHVSHQDWIKHIQYVPQYNANTLDPKNSVLDFKTTFKTL